MSDIDTLIQWCQEAREILKSTGGKKGKAALALDKEIQKVAVLLRELTRLAGESASVQTLHAEFERIASQAHDLGGNTKLLKIAPDAVRAQAKAVTKDLLALEVKLKKAKPAAEDVAKYLRLMQTCQNARRSLETQPYADVSDVSNVIHSAVLGDEALDDPVLVKSALKVLEGFKGAKESAIKKQAKGAQQAESQLKMQAECRHRLRECEEARAEAQQSVGLEAQALVLTKTLKAAGELTAAGRWADALDLLNGKAKGTPAMPRLEAVKKAAAQAMSEQPAAVQQAYRLLAQYKTLIDTATYAEDAAKVLATVREAPDFERGGAAKMLASARDFIEGKVNAFTEVKREVDGLTLTATQKLTGGRTGLAVEEAQVLGDALDRLKAEITQRRLQRARELAAPLLARIEKALLDAGQARSTWSQIEGAFETRLADLRKHGGDVAAPAEARGRCLRLAETTARDRTLMLEGRDWEGLAQRHQAMKDEIDAFARANGEFEKFADERRAGDSTVQDEIHALELAFKQAEGALSNEEGVDAGKLLAPLRQALADIASAWQRRVANAASPAALDLKGTTDALALLGTRLADAVNPEGVVAARRTQADEASQAAFNLGVQSLESTFLAELSHIDTAAGQALRERMDKLAGDSGQPWAARVKLLETLALEMKTAAELARKQRSDRAPGLLQRCDDLAKALDVEHDKLKSSNDKAFEPLFIELTARLADQRALATTPNAGAADAVTQALDTIAQQIGSIASRTASGSAFDQVRKDLKALEGDIGKASADLGMNVPKSLATLKQLVLTLKTDMLGLTPAAATEEIAALRTSLGTAQTEARDVSALRTGFATLQPVVESKIKALAELGTVAAFVGVAQQRLAAMVKQAANPERLLLSKQQLDALNKDIEDAYLHPEKGLEMQGKAQADAERKRLQEVECKSTLAHLRKTGVQRAEQAIKGADGDPALLAEINRMLKDTAAVVKAGDFADGLRKLALVQQRIDEVVDDPQGPGIGSRKALPRDAQLFADSARKLLAGLGDLPEMVGAKLDRVPEPVLAQLGKLLDGLTARLNPALFDSPAGQLSDSQIPVRDRRATRETALASLRGLRSLLAEHPQFAAVWRNPFHVALKACKAEIDQRLLRLEANIRRSVH